MNPVLRQPLVFALGVLAACAGKAAAAPPAPLAEWRIERQEDKDGNPHSTVDLVINGKQVVRLVSPTGVESYQVLPAGEYADYKVPAKALCACFSWWAGSGTRLYAIADSSGDVTVYRMEVEEQVKSAGWKRDRRIHVASP